jgi:hypothetical protein
MANQVFFHISVSISLQRAKNWSENPRIELLSSELEIACTWELGEPVPTRKVQLGVAFLEIFHPDPALRPVSNTVVEMCSEIGGITLRCQICPQIGPISKICYHHSITGIRQVWLIQQNCKMQPLVLIPDDLVGIVSKPGENLGALHSVARFAPKLVPFPKSVTTTPLREFARFGLSSRIARCNPWYESQTVLLENV